MTTSAMIGIGVAVLAVLFAYWSGFSQGYARGRDEGFGDGKREGTKEGSMRGYAVGFDRGRRNREPDEQASSQGGLGFGVVGLLLAAGAILTLASRGQDSRQRAVNPATQNREQLSGSAARGVVTGPSGPSNPQVSDAEPWRPSWPEPGRAQAPQETDEWIPPPQTRAANAWPE